MRIVIVGSVAAGTSVGAKVRRNTETAEIVVYDRDHDISYSGCGLPYYVGGEVDDIDALTPRDAAWFAERYIIDIRTGHEVTGVIPASRSITVTDFASGARFTDSSDELVLATGVSPIVPPLPGVTAAGVFTAHPGAGRGDSVLDRRHRRAAGGGGRSFTATFAGIAPASALPFIAAQLVGAAIGAAQTELFHPRVGVTPEPLDLPGPVHDDQPIDPAHPRQGEHP